MQKLAGTEWLEWAQHPKTQEFAKLLRAEVTEQQQEWGAGRFNKGRGPWEIALVNSVAQAYTETLDKVVWTLENVEIEQKKEEA